MAKTKEIILFILIFLADFKVRILHEEEFIRKDVNDFEFKLAVFVSDFFDSVKMNNPFPYINEKNEVETTTIGLLMAKEEWMLWSELPFILFIDKNEKIWLKEFPHYNPMRAYSDSVEDDLFLYIDQSKGFPKLKMLKAMLKERWNKGDKGEDVKKAILYIDSLMKSFKGYNYDYEIAKLLSAELSFIGMRTAYLNLLEMKKFLKERNGEMLAFAVFHADTGIAEFDLTASKDQPMLYIIIPKREPNLLQMDLLCNGRLIFRKRCWLNMSYYIKIIPLSFLSSGQSEQE